MEIFIATYAFQHFLSTKLLFDVCVSTDTYQILSTELKSIVG